ncbi:MAG TPA: hypothetical protein VN364_10365 [Bellilinea sp.]|nr:hypothetical protein [Bellilinea sp.]
MSHAQRSAKTSTQSNLPPFALQAAARLGIEVAALQGWALRPDGSVVLLCANGMKFVVAPE